MITKRIEINIDSLQKLFGVLDSNIRLIEKELRLKAVVRGGCLELSGDEANVEKGEGLLNSLIVLIGRGVEIDRARVLQSLDMAMADKSGEIVQINQDIITITAKGRQITAKTLGQKEYVKAMKANTVVLCLGPAGSGKTYLAVAMAYSAFKAGLCEKIILTRPALEAGEKLGFLPGDLQTKIDPYLRPLYDALTEMFGFDNYQKLMERGAVEVAPLAYMRGRTLNNAYIILDEAQNTTQEQMKMFLTRLGFKSKMFITGDVTQIDLPFGKNSGLLQAAGLLKDVEDISVVRLSDKDVVRHELVQRIVTAYATHEEAVNKNSAADSSVSQKV